MAQYRSGSIARICIEWWTAYLGYLKSDQYPVTWRNEIDIAFEIAQEIGVIEPVGPRKEWRLRFVREFAHYHQGPL